MLDGYNPDVAAFYAHNYCPLPLSDPPGHLKGATHLCCPDAVHADLHNRAELYGRIPKTPGEVVPWDERPYRRVRWAHCSNFANIARPVIARAQELGPHYFKIQGYGMSESLACMAAWDRFRYMERTADGWRQVAVPDLDVVSRAGGRLNFPAEMDVKVVDPDTGKDQPCDRDHPGEIYFRGPQIQIGYLRNPEATNKSLVPAHPNDPDQRPWFKTGDFGYMVGPTKEDGFCFLNRLGDSLRLRGFLTNPGKLNKLFSFFPCFMLLPSQEKSRT